MVKIDTSYGEFSVEKSDGNIIKTKDIDELIEILLPESTDNPTTQVITYVSDEDALADAADLTVLAALCCWGNRLYKGDNIKLTITAEYCPEDK